MDRPIMLVTGASRGIGAATARMAAQRGYAVAVNYAASATAADELVAELRAAGHDALAVRADVADEADVVAMFEAVDERLGPLDVLVNNAGTAGGYGHLVDLDAQATRRMLDVNVLGSMLCCREALKRMLPRRSGSIVNVSSAAARVGGATEWVNYAASKGAIDTLSVGLAREVASAGVRVNAIRPGLVDTDFNDHATPGRLERILPALPMGRCGTVEEIAESILWLAGPAASYVTGAVLDVTGAR